MRENNQASSTSQLPDILVDGWGIELTANEQNWNVACHVNGEVAGAASNVPLT